jgi:hypothetical protein
MIESDKEAGDTAATGSETDKPPDATFASSNGITIRVWRPLVGASSADYAIRIGCSRQNARGQVESQPLLRESDLLRTSELLHVVDAWIEKEKLHKSMTSHSR